MNEQVPQRHTNKSKWCFSTPPTLWKAATLMPAQVLLTIHATTNSIPVYMMLIF
jgi:hypothetical protein